MKKEVSLLILLLIAFSNIFAQETFPTNDVRDKRTRAFAFINATIIIDYQKTISNSTLIIRDGKIEQVGQGITPPTGYVVLDLGGKYIYPSFIDPYTEYGQPEQKITSSSSPWSNGEQISSDTRGAYNANEAIKSHYNAAEFFSINEKQAKIFRESGFGSVASFRADGIARGTSAFVSLDNSSDNSVLLNSNASANYSFSKGTSSQFYPYSLMGYIALMRQTYLDAEWYSTTKSPGFYDISLEAFNNTQNLPQIFDTNDWLAALRADKLGDEFSIQYIIKGSGDEYQRVKEIKGTGAKFIIPLKFPAAYNVDNPIDAKLVTLTDLKHWEMAPANPAILEKNGIQFAITSYGLKETKDFLPNLRKAVKYGLSESYALKAITQMPAEILNAYNSIGSLEKNKVANFIITSKPIFDEESQILENWIQGNKHYLEPIEQTEFSGKYTLRINNEEYSLQIEDNASKSKVKIILNDTTEINVTHKLDKNLVEFSFKINPDAGLIRLAGWVTSNGFKGKGNLVDGSEVDWEAIRTGDLDQEEENNEKENEEINLGEIIYPFVGHGMEKVPTSEEVLIKNATLWTNEDQGIIENTDILFKDGKISKIGKNLSSKKARVIDGTGKHVTSGIIDEHSHIALSSVNDVATNSGMVRMGDVIDPTSSGIYTSLSGGVTALQLLHGSANPIGGQSALVKARWGVSPEEMKIEGADGFIKFALGENVKRSSNSNSVRYPQTRMGVEQVYVDAFTNAQEYKKEWDTYNNLPTKTKASAIPPRRDLAMETMVEILEGKRFITCHSYVQSEINMLMKVAERFNFRINTFTHILEGYKVADKMAAHGVGGSTFSDWWNYKWEVRYAIPQNATIMHNAGVLTAINSDNREMGRRLNQEAAKSVKYGGMSQEDAWKLVTLNPAKLLHLDDRMGSLKEGKDADIVIWSDNPLSIYAKVESTFVDGINYFNAEREAEMVKNIESERARIIQKMKGVKEAGGEVQNVIKQRRETFECENFTIDTSIQND